MINLISYHLFTKMEGTTPTIKTMRARFNQRMKYLARKSQIFFPRIGSQTKIKNKEIKILKMLLRK